MDKKIMRVPREKRADYFVPKHGKLAVVPAQPGWEVIELYDGITEWPAGKTADQLIATTPIVAWIVDMSAPDEGAIPVTPDSYGSQIAVRTPTGVVICYGAASYDNTKDFVLDRIAALQKK